MGGCVLGFHVFCVDFQTPTEPLGDVSSLSGRPVIGRLIPKIPRGSQSAVLLPSSIIKESLSSTDHKTMKLFLSGILLAVGLVTGKSILLNDSNVELAYVYCCEDNEVLIVMCILAADCE